MFLEKKSTHTGELSDGTLLDLDDDDNNNNNKLSFITKAAELHALRLILLWLLAVDFGAHELKLEIPDCEKSGLFVTTVQLLLSLLPKDPPPQTTDSGYHYHHHHQ
jgi:hypothetical protein